MAWRWETFREIADPYHSQSIRRRHTWRPILPPHPYFDPQSPPTPHHNTPHALLTSSSKKQASNSPTGPGGLPRKPSCARSGTHFARWQGARSHSGGGTLGQQQQLWGPRTAAYTSPGHPGLGGRAHIPQQSPRFASTCEYICRICPNGISGSGETFPPLRTGLVCPVKGAP